ncbi:hypothetical protein PoB_005402200 [Plakobranchus ocellatus]|uniref:Uncharacterized protein n=1 Tax=Plakobranchus ocellatus TaxID=259542 RepID=A0AAV4C826_9GAST|nr:hypothetical protein PoB_005402200 [Plakobranchus ocellatus]
MRRSKFKFISIRMQPVHNNVISGYWALRQARAPVAGLEPSTEGSLQISGRTRQPLSDRRPDAALFTYLEQAWCIRGHVTRRSVARTRSRAARNVPATQASVSPQVSYGRAVPHNTQVLTTNPLVNPNIAVITGGPPLHCPTEL